MRVLCFTASYPPVLGGLQTVAAAVARGLMRRGHRIEVVTNRYPRSLPPRETLSGVPVRRFLFLRPDFTFLGRGRPDLFLASLYYYPVVLRRLTALAKGFRPDVVNVHYPLGQIPFVLRLRRCFDFRLVVSLHGDELLEPMRRGIDDPRLRAILREADAVTACSRWLLGKAEGWEPAVRGKGVVIPNGINPERFEDKTPYRHSRPYLLAFGRLSHQKGFDLLLKAFARVAPEKPGLDLILAGDGEERERLTALADGLGIKGRIVFFGRAAPEEVVRLLNGCEFVIIPSRWEPFGIVALEALAAGKPVLATRVGGLAELAAESGGTMRLVAPGEEGLYRGLLEMSERRGREGAAGDFLDTARTRFSWENMIGGYERILAEG